MDIALTESLGCGGRVYFTVYDECWLLRCIKVFQKTNYYLTLFSDALTLTVFKQKLAL